MRTLKLECLSRTVKICFRRFQTLNFISVIFGFIFSIVSKERRDVVTHALCDTRNDRIMLLLRNERSKPFEYVVLYSILSLSIRHCENPVHYHHPLQCAKQVE